MVKHALLAVLFMGIVSLVTSSSLPAPAPSRDDKVARVDALFKKYDRPDSPGAAVIAVQDGRIVLQRAYGSASLEYRIPITSRTVFHIGSVSKQFTGFSLLLLEQLGLLRLDDDVRRYVPEVPDFGRTITLRHLLHHQSGLREQETLFQVSGISTADLIETSHILKLVGRQKELDFNPGEDVSYSNTGYVLLAQVVEKVTGASFSRWTHENIFSPLAMNDTQFNDDATRIVRGRAYPYYTADGGTLHKGILSYSYVGPTSLLTTAQDMAKWLLNLGQPRVGNPAIIRRMLFESGKLQNGEDPGYGYGIGVLRYRGLRVVWHSGQDAGYRAFAAYFPDQRFGVAVLSNFHSLSPSDVGKKIADVYLSRAMSPESPEPAAPAKKKENREPDESLSLKGERLTKFTGDYWSEELETRYRIQAAGDRLVMRHWRNDDVVLTAVGPDQFSGNQEYADAVRFLRNAAGDITGFRLTAGRVRGLLFERMDR